MQHITTCICTYKRPKFLGRLLDELVRQETGGCFTHSIVVADNDLLRSAEPVVLACAGRSPIPIRYCVEPRQNISLARNKAIDHAEGSLVAFIDDDEFPGRDWLFTLFHALQKYAADGVLGPVRPHYEIAPPEWVIKGKFHERATYATGFIIDWKKGRTGNVLLSRQLFAEDPPPFRPEFRSGEDQDFFRRMIARGHVFIWCNEAVAYEIVPPLRWNPTFMLRRAILSGSASLLHPSGWRKLGKSAFAVPAYTAALPIALLLGRDRLMHCLIRLCDHVGRLLASVGINPIREPYVTE
jgi:succinoglycan biosynthesis protein ExoM